MTRTLLGATLALGLLVFSGQPAALAGGALIETTAPLTDRSQESVRAAVIAAIDRAVRGAAAMGFAWFQLTDAQVSGDEVAVQILATNEEPDDSVGVRPPEASDATEEEQRAEEPEPRPEAPPSSPSRVHI